MKSWSLLVPKAPGGRHISHSLRQCVTPRFHYDLFLTISVETHFILPLQVRMTAHYNSERHIKADSVAKAMLGG